MFGGMSEVILVPTRFILAGLDLLGILFFHLASSWMQLGDEIESEWSITVQKSILCRESRGWAHGSDHRNMRTDPSVAYRQKVRGTRAPYNTAPSILGRMALGDPQKTKAIESVGPNSRAGEAKEPYGRCGDRIWFLQWKQITR